MRTHITAGFIGLALAGCASSGALKEQVARAEAAQKNAETTRAQLDEANRSIESLKKELDTARADATSAKASEQELIAKLKSAEDKIATLQKSNRDLQQTLEAKKGDLPKKLSELIKERDALQSKLNEQLQAKTN